MKLLLFAVFLCCVWTQTEGTNQTEGATAAFDHAEGSSGTNQTESATDSLSDAGASSGTNQTESGTKALSDAGASSGTNQTERVNDAGVSSGTNKTESGTDSLSDVGASSGTNQTESVDDAGVSSGTNKTESGTASLSDAGTSSGTNQTESGTASLSDAGSSSGTNQTESGSNVLGDAAAGSSGCWTDFSGRRFKLVKKADTWAKAQQHCVNMGGNLATIHNDEEEQFLKVFAEGERAWIGLTDAQQNNLWFWMNSDPLTHTNWCKNEPNNAGGNQECVVINFSGKKCWDDERCSKSFNYICEKAA